jgi:Skp family chaperone for outer membrane proteins
MAAVFKGYKKFDNFTAEMKGYGAQLDQALKAKRDKIDQLTKDMNNPAMADKHDANQKQITQIQREMEDTNADMRKWLTQRAEEQTVIIYSEIKEASRLYAAAHGLDMVLTYVEPTDPKDVTSPGNIMVKMQQRACMPLYYAPSMDISQAIVDTLNASYKPPAPTGTPTATTPGTPHQ